MSGKKTKDDKNADKNCESAEDKTCPPIRNVTHPLVSRPPLALALSDQLDPVKDGDASSANSPNDH